MITFVILYWKASLWTFRIESSSARETIMGTANYPGVQGMKITWISGNDYGKGRLTTGIKEWTRGSGKRLVERADLYTTQRTARTRK